MRQETTNYVDGEGRNFMRECIDQSIEWCVRTGLNKLVIFTGTGEGPHYAAKEVLSQDRYAQLDVIAVTPAVGRQYRANPNDPNSPMIRAGINPAIHEELLALDVGIVAAHLPFKGIQVGRERSSEWSRVAEAYGVLGGGFALCIQAVLVACDAGVIQSGERVVAVSSDTAFVAIASRTESFLSPTEGLLIEHIICRPLRYRISKPTHTMVEQMWAPITISEPPQLEAAVRPEPEGSPPEPAPPPSPSPVPTSTSDASLATVPTKRKRGKAAAGK